MSGSKLKPLQLIATLVKSFSPIKIGELKSKLCRIKIRAWKLKVARCQTGRSKALGVSPVEVPGSLSSSGLPVSAAIFYLLSQK